MLYSVGFGNRGRSLCVAETDGRPGNVWNESVDMDGALKVWEFTIIRPRADPRLLTIDCLQPHWTPNVENIASLAITNVGTGLPSVN